MSFTLIYSLRLIYFSSINYTKIIIINLTPINNIIFKSIIILILITLILGSIINWIIFSRINLIFLNKINKLLIYFIFFFSNFLTILINKNNFFKKFNYTIKFINNIFLLNLFYKKRKKNTILINLNLIKNNDIGWLEYLFTNLLVKNIKNIIISLNLNFLIKIIIIRILIIFIILIYLNSLN